MPPLRDLLSLLLSPLMVFVRRLPSEVAHSPLAVLSVAAPHRPSDAVLCVSRPSRSPPLLQCCPLPLPTWCCPPGVVRPSDAVLCISRPSWSPPQRPFRLPPQTFWVVPSLAVLSVAAPRRPSDAVLCASILSCPLRDLLGRSLIDFLSWQPGIVRRCPSETFSVSYSPLTVLSIAAPQRSPIPLHHCHPSQTF